MKPITLLLTLLLSATAGASVNPYDLLVWADASSRTLTLRTTTEVAEATRVYLEDAYGNQLFDKTLERGDFLSLRFELSDLTDGDYELIIRDSRGQTTQPIHVEGTGITADPAGAERIFFPRCELLAGNTLRVNYLNVRGQTVTIWLEDDRGREVFSETIPGDTPIQRAYALSSLRAGRYRVRVKAKTIATHTTDITLR